MRAPRPLTALLTVLALSTAALVAAPIAASAATTPGVRINEVETSGGTPGDWIELLNTGATAVDLSGWVIKDSKEATPFTVPTGTTIEPGGFVVIDAFHATNAPIGFAYGLGDGDSVRVFDATGTPVDERSWGPHAATTYGVKDGAAGATEWLTTLAPTKGAANTFAPPVVVPEDPEEPEEPVDPTDPGVLRINEVDSSPSDWVEFVNTGGAALDVSGFEIRDNSDDHRWRFPTGSSIAAGGFLVVEADATGEVHDGTAWVPGTFAAAIGIGSGDEIRLFDQAGAIIDRTGIWTAHAAIGRDEAAATLARCVDGVGEFRLAFITKGATNDCVPPAIAINEINSNGTDWVEIINAGTASVDISGWSVMDDDPVKHAAETTPLPTGTVLAAGARLVLTNGIDFVFGLGNGDTVTLRDASGATIDEHVYLRHATGSWARCPEGTGAFAEAAVGTPGQPNSCAPVEPETPTLQLGVWPGGIATTVLDPAPTFLEDSSGLDFQATAGGGVLWAIDNGTGTLWKLDVRADGTVAPAAGWATGKRIRFQKDAGNPSAAGPDTEGVTVDDAGFVYAASERDNSAKAVNFNVVLKVDPNAAGPDLVALQEWDLTATLPAVGANLGIEAVEWVADADLGGLWDVNTGAVYDPARYPLHGDGLFFVAVEDRGRVFAVALNSDGTHRLVADVTPGLTGVMALDYDAVLGALWAVCDDGCSNAAALIDFNGTAEPTVTGFRSPAGLPVANHEGFATAPFSIGNAVRPAWWFTDGVRPGSLRLGTLPGTVLPPTGDAPAPVADAELTEAAKGGISVPSRIVAGETLVVKIGAERAGQIVRVWLHSTPTLLGSAVVAANGTATVLVPAATPAGDHRIVVANEANVLIGWAPVRIAAAASGSLEATGSENGWMGGAVIAALLLLGTGGIVVARRRTA